MAKKKSVKKRVTVKKTAAKKKPIGKKKVQSISKTFVPFYFVYAEV